MFSLLKKLLLFRIGQKTSKGFSHRIGLHGIAWMVGLLGGFRYMRRHS